MTKRPLVIGIAGASCSGKSTLARGLADELPGGGLVIEVDWYYRDQAGRSIHDIDVDTPGAIEHELLVSHLARLMAGEAVERPAYDYVTHARAAAGVVVNPAPNLIVEGLFALYWPELRALLDRALFLDADRSVCLARRIERDVRERGRSADDIRRQFDTKVFPMYERHVLPTRRHAGLVLDGTGPAAAVLAATRSWMASE